MRTIKFKQIRWKLLVTYLAVVGVCLSVAIAVARQLTISSFSEHMRMMGHRMGAPMSTVVSEDLNQAFREALNVSLLIGGLSAALVAVVASLLISRRITRPVHDMAAATERIAEGDFSQRVGAHGEDEIGSLAHSLNRMAERLQEAENLRRDLIGNLAHELRTPLTSISGYMEALADGVVPASAETYGLVHQEADRLSRLVDDLQRLSRAESGQERLNFAEVAPGVLLEQAVKKLKPQFESKQVDLQFEVEARTPALRADPDKLEQVLVNLLDNALSYTRAGGRVILSGRSQGVGVALEVADTGIGIAPEDLPHIFERFYRADKSRSRERGGSGIGLTIAKRYVEAMGGDIQVASSPGKGARFTVIMPVSKG